MNNRKRHESFQITERRLYKKYTHDDWFEREKERKKNDIPKHAIIDHFPQRANLLAFSFVAIDNKQYVLNCTKEFNARLTGLTQLND